MTFASVVIFLIIYYIRPQEWIGALNALSPIKLVMVFSLVALLTRQKGLKPRDIFQTPHDWIVFAFFGWAIATSSTPWPVFMDLLKYMVFYIVIVQALDSVDKFTRFLNWWTGMLITLAFLAVASMYGFDPMGSKDLTQGIMEGRLSLNTSIFNNPNALGHSIVPVILLIYCQLIWRRPVFMKEIGTALLILPLFCIYETKSKGAYISGFATMLIGYIFGRPLIAQFLTLLIAFTFGMTALKALPRMDDLSGDEGGVQGRLQAFEYGYSAMNKNLSGIHYGNWNAKIYEWRDGGWQPRSLASHSGYVRIGAELGKPGLFLYLGLLYACARTLFSAKTPSLEEQRIRRLLLALTVSFAISSWMINWEFRATYFMTAAAVAAFHRWLSNPKRELPEKNAPELAGKVKTDGEQEPGIKWSKLGWKDFAAMCVILLAALRFWEFAMTGLFE